MSQFFQDIMNDPNINWGTNPFSVRTTTKQKKDGYTVPASTADVLWSDVSSPQLMDLEQVIRNGWGDFANGEVYECYVLRDLPINTDPKNYRTIIFNGREYEIIKCSFFGVNKGTPEEDGYYELAFGRRITNQGAQ